ncbi:hypothetical protein HNR42_001872 [Deinobacterium chartae]|uniref:Helix-turn-helix domain-containing protein n=1 Tax=Deinobacterium chartae TaxID=521158 RepID=A0A841I271_9DEIO|nr:helix-turn-helix domain-containing protein [Deinobacterium chartae]MBB6098438.1 hypothetical protein [Deinobacterium chartae]
MTAVQLSSVPVVIHDPEAAGLLCDPTRVRYLHPFLDREVTLSAAAAELGIPLSRMHYWAERLLALGLITVTRSERRSGRPIRHFRSVAPEFRVAFSATPLGSLEELLSRNDGSYQRLLNRAEARQMTRLEGEWSLRLYREPGGAVHGEGGFGRPREAAFSGWLKRPLSGAQARALRAELEALMERYARLEPDDDQPTYLLRLALCEIPQGLEEEGGTL